MDMLIGLTIGFGQLIIGLLLAMGSVYIGLKLLDKLTKGIDEMKELKNGNIAVGIFMAAVIFSIATVVQSGVAGLSEAVTGKTGGALIIAAGIGVIQLLIGIAIAVVAIYIAVNVLDKITVEIDEMEELKKGNVAVAILMAGVLLAVSFVVQAGVSGIARAIGIGI
ncbi:MAG: DUF350 domain-containing protein [Methanocellales archaeon]